MLLCVRVASQIAYVIRSLCLAHCAHDIYHCTVFSRQEYRSGSTVYTNTSNTYACMSLNPVWSPVWFLCFVIVCFPCIFPSTVCLLVNSTACWSDDLKHFYRKNHETTPFKNASRVQRPPMFFSDRYINGFSILMTKYNNIYVNEK